MLYHLFEWLSKKGIHFPGSNLFSFITFRVLLAMLLSLVITTVYGKKLIRFLRKRQIGETIRDEGLAGQASKSGTPTMGGIIIILAIIIPTLLLANLNKVYIRVMLVSTVWLGIIGFIDDYLKLRGKRLAQQRGEVYKKTSKDGLAGWFKILGQVGIGVLVGATLYFNSNVKIWREYVGVNPAADSTAFPKQVNGKTKYYVETKTPVTTIPFVKNHEFNYSKLLPAAWRDYTWVLYILIVIFIITAVSNGSNLTDGLDGLAIMPIVMVAAGLGVFAYLSGDIRFANYLHISYVKYTSELVVVCSAMVGAGLAFLWYNAHPAQVFMGDVGALALGAMLGTIAVMVRQEIVFAIMGGVFVMEAVSVFLQIGSLRMRNKRVFLMAPLHHHYEKQGWKETQVVIRFWIITIFLVVLGLMTLKLR